MRNIIRFGIPVAILGFAFVRCSSSSNGNDAGGNDAGGGTDSGTVTDSGTDAGPYSLCGHPGDQGNSIGVGKFCEQISDCDTANGLLCSTINNPNNPNQPTYFCVLPCDPCSPPGYCGSGATCVCQNGDPNTCGCTPSTCSAIFPDGGEPPCTNDGGMDAGGGDGGCVPTPVGSCNPDTCAPGNAMHIGEYCTALGGQCGSGLFCAVLGGGGNYCVSLNCNANSDCGTGACCTPTGMASPYSSCVPSGCLVDAGDPCPLYDGG